MSRFEDTIVAEPDRISAVTEAVINFLDENGVDARTGHHVGLVIDEMLTNLATHGKSTNPQARITVEIEPDRVKGAIIDTGPAFDPRDAPDPALEQPAAERPVGGLGLYLVRKVTCALEYVRQDGENRTTFAVARGER